MQCTLDGFLQLTLSVHQRAEDLGERVMETHGNFAGGDGHLPEALGQMRAVAFEDSRAEGSPDQSLGDVGFGGIKGVQTGVALPLLEHELHLPAQPIGITNLLEGESARGRLVRR